MQLATMQIEDSADFCRQPEQKSSSTAPSQQAQPSPVSLPRSAKLVLAEWLTSTSTHGVGQCIKAHSIAARLLWLLLIAACLGASVWHLTTLLSQYVDFPTTMSMSEVNLPSTLPDVVLCNSDLVSTYRLGLLNNSQRRELESAYQRYLRVSLKAGADKGQVSYTTHFKKLFYRLPIAAAIRPQPQDVIVGFTYGEQLEGKCFDFRSYLADINDRLMICYRLILNDVIHRLQLSNLSFSQEVMKLLLFKRPRVGDSFSSFFETDWAKNEALKLLLQESGEDALQLFLVDGVDAVNSQAVAGAKSMQLTHGKHYDVEVSPVMYENSDPSDCMKDETYRVEDVLSNFSINYSRINCQTLKCAETIARDFNCTYSGIIVFTDMSIQLGRDCSTFSDNLPSDDEFASALELQRVLRNRMKRSVSCNGSEIVGCPQEACVRFKRTLDASSYEWPYLSQGGSRNYSSEFRTSGYLKSALNAFRKAMGNETSQIIDTYPQSELTNETDTWYLLRVFIHYQADTMLHYAVSRKFAIHDLLSDFGGALGVWLGASFLTLSELLVLAASLCQLLLRRRPILQQRVGT